MGYGLPRHLRRLRGAARSPGRDLPHLRLAAAGGSRRRAGGKSPLLAALLGIVPGLGHLYVGERWKGLGIMAALGAVELVGLDLDLTVIGAALGVPAELGGLGLWVYSIVDAYHAARRAG